MLIPILHKTFPQAKVVTEPSYDSLPDFYDVDGALWSLTQGDALAAAHPELIAVPTQGLGNPVLFVYLVPPGSEDFLKTVNFWLLLNRDSGIEKQESAYWIERSPAADRTPAGPSCANFPGKNSAIALYDIRQQHTYR